jgi:hypothetical protein
MGRVACGIAANLAFSNSRGLCVETEYDNESWIIHAGDAVVQRRVSQGVTALIPLDRLYCLWVADYSMRNAGDLHTANDLYAAFQDEAARLSQELGLPVTQSAFSLHRCDLEQRYFAIFDDVCNEIRAFEGQGISSE